MLNQNPQVKEPHTETISIPLKRVHDVWPHRKNVDKEVIQKSEKEKTTVI